jgi:hypothetical protein
VPAVGPASHVLTRRPSRALVELASGRVPCVRQTANPPAKPREPRAHDGRPHWQRSHRAAAGRRRRRSFAHLEPRAWRHFRVTPNAVFHIEPSWNDLRPRHANTWPSASRQRGVVAGQVLWTRYHAVALRLPAQVRNTLRYVLLNRKHHAPAAKRFVAGWIDPYAVGPWFRGWQRRFARTPSSVTSSRSNLRRNRRRRGSCASAGGALGSCRTTTRYVAASTRRWRARRVRSPRDLRHSDPHHRWQADVAARV